MTPDQAGEGILILLPGESFHELGIGQAACGFVGGESMQVIQYFIELSCDHEGPRIPGMTFAV